ncbi:hypothetical protein [Kitasatospora sp. NPDC094016]|uniref:hypothetical protein n=1 Tax=Kitasatospora sp. NPDC094016 TaxID=3154986 RepID=UPI0033263CD1
MQVVEFLDLACRALNALPLERIEREAVVPAAEGGRGASTAGAGRTSTMVITDTGRGRLPRTSAVCRQGSR